MSGSSQQDMFLQAMAVMFSLSLPSRDILTAANAFIYDFSQQRDCFFTCMLVLNDQSVTDLAVHAFCSNILYNKIRKQLSQLSEGEVHQLQEALILLVQSQSFLQIVSNQYRSKNNINNNESPQQQQQRRDMRNVARTVFRCVAALAVAAPLSLSRVSIATQLATQLLSFEHPCATISALQLLSFLQEESEACYLSRRQRKPLATHLRHTYRSLYITLLPTLLRETLCPALSKDIVSCDTTSAEEIAALCRAVSDLCRALAECDGRTVRDLHIAENPQTAFFLLQIATQDTLLVNQLCVNDTGSVSRHVISEELSQAAVQANLALRVYCSRSLLSFSHSSATQQDTDEIPADETVEAHSTTQLLDLYLENVSKHTVLGGVASELCRRECVATLMSLCLSGRLHDTLCVRHIPHHTTHTASAMSRHRGCVLLETLLSLCFVSQSRDNSGVFLLTLDFWLDTLDTLLYRRPVNSLYVATQGDSTGHAGHCSDTDEAQGSQSDSDDSGDTQGHTDKLDVDEGLFALLTNNNDNSTNNSIYNNSTSYSNNSVNINRDNLQWLLTRLLPRFLYLALHFSLLPHHNIPDEDTDNSEEWDSVSAWRDIRHGSDELVTLCVAACGLRHILPLLVYLASTISVSCVSCDTDKCDTVLRHTLSVSTPSSDITSSVQVVTETVSQLLLSLQPFQFDALLFMLGHTSGVSQRLPKSRDTFVTHRVLHMIATQAVSQAVTHVRHIQQLCSCVNASWEWQSVSQEIAVSRSAMFLRSAVKFLLSYATSLSTSDASLTPPLLEVSASEEVRHVTATQAVCELCVSFSVSPGVATHSFILNNANNVNNAINNNNHHRCMSEEWSLESATQVSIAVSQSAETLRRLLLSQRKQLITHVPQHNQETQFLSYSATQLAVVATQILSGIVSLLVHSRHNITATQWDTLPMYATQLIESGVSSLLTAATHMVSYSETPEILCGVATQVVTQCDILMTHLLLFVSQIIQCVAKQSHATMSVADSAQACRAVSRLLSLVSCFVESLVQDTPVTHNDALSDIHVDTLVSQMLLSLYPVLHLLHNKNSHIFNNNNSYTTINNDNGTVIEAVCLLTQQTETLVSYLLHSYPDSSPLLSSFGYVATLCHIQTEAFHLKAQLSHILSWSMALCRNNTLVSHLSLNNSNSRSETLLRHIATHLQQPHMSHSDTPWQWFVAQRNTIFSVSQRQVCVSLCRSLHSICVSDNNNYSITHVSRRVIGCVSTLRVLERHLTTLQHILYDTASVPSETHDEYYQDIVSLRNSASQGTNVFSFSLWQEHLLEILKSSSSVAVTSSCVEVYPEVQIMLVTHALRVATQMLTVTQVCPGCYLVSNRELLMLCRETESVADVLCRVTLHHFLPHLTNLNNHNSETQSTSYCYSDSEVTLCRDTWVFVSTLLSCDKSVSPSNIWQEVCRDTLHLEETGVTETIMTLALRQMLLFSFSNNNNNNNNIVNTYHSYASNASFAAVSTSAEHTLILLLCLLCHKIQSGTSSHGHSVAVNLVQTAVSQACPAVLRQLDELHISTPSNTNSFSLQHIAQAILQQVSQVATQKFPPTATRLRRVKQLLQDLLRVSQGLQQVEVLADYLFV